MGNALARTKEQPAAPDDVIDGLRTLAQAYREDQKLLAMGQIIRDLHSPKQRQLFRSIAVRPAERGSPSAVEHVMRGAQASFNAGIKQATVDLLLLLATTDGPSPSEHMALVDAGVSQLVLDVFAYAKAYKSPVHLVETTITLVDLFIEYENFADQFITSGGSKILFGQLIANYTSEVPKQKAIHALSILAKTPKYIKQMSESGGVTALVKSLGTTESVDFLSDALKIITTVCKNNVKLLTTIMETPAHIDNVLRLLRREEAAIISETVFILHSLAVKDKLAVSMHERGGFQAVFHVLRKRLDLGPAFLFHCISALASMLVTDESRTQFVTEGGLHLTKELLAETQIALVNTTPATPTATPFSRGRRAPRSKETHRESDTLTNFDDALRTAMKHAENTNALLRAAIRLIERLADTADLASTVAKELAYAFSLRLIASVSLNQMGIAHYDYSDSFAGDSTFQVMASPSSTASIFELILSAIAVLTKLCQQSVENISALPTQDRFSKLLTFLQPSNDNRMLRIISNVLKLLDVLFGSDVEHGIRRVIPPLPMSPVVAMVISTSLCDILQHPYDAKASSNTAYWSTNVTFLSLKVLRKLAIREDLRYDIFDHLPMEFLHRLLAMKQPAESRTGSGVTNTRTIADGARALIDELCLTPSLQEQFRDAGLLSADASGFSFDEEGRRRRRVTTRQLRLNANGEEELYYEDTWEYISDGEDEEEPEDEVQQPEEELATQSDAAQASSIEETKSAPLIRRRFKSSVDPRATRYVVQFGDTLPLIAERTWRNSSKWLSIIRPDGRRFSKPSVVLRPGVVLLLPQSDEISLTPEEKAHLKRCNSAPLPKKRPWDQPTQPPSARSRARRASLEAANRAMKAKQSREEMRKRLRTELARVNRDFLLEYQEILDNETAERQQLANSLDAGVHQILQFMEERIRFTGRALSEHDFLTEHERMARFSLHRVRIDDLESVNREEVAAAERRVLFVVLKMVEQQRLEKRFRTNIGKEEDETFAKAVADFNIARAKYIEFHWSRQRMQQEEAEFRRTLLQSYTNWALDTRLTADLLDVEHTFSVEFEQILAQEEAEFTTFASQFDASVQDAVFLEETRLRAALSADAQFVMSCHSVFISILHAQSRESVQRAALERHSFGLFQQLFSTMRGVVADMVVAEETAARQQIAAAAFVTLSSEVGAAQRFTLEAQEFLRRRTIHSECAAVWRKVHLKFSNDNLVLLQEAEQNRRHQLVFDWLRWATKMALQLHRLHLIGAERIARSTLQKDMLEALKAILRLEKQGGLAIRLNALTKREPFPRMDLISEESQARWTLRVQMLIHHETTERRIWHKLERREYSRVGRGLQDYVHMLELDRTSQLFNIWRPNDVLLVPFVVPKPKLRKQPKKTADTRNSPSRPSSALALSLVNSPYNDPVTPLRAASAASDRNKALSSPITPNQRIGSALPRADARWSRPGTSPLLRATGSPPFSPISATPLFAHRYVDSDFDEASEFPRSPAERAAMEAQVDSHLRTMLRLPGAERLLPSRMHSLQTPASPGLPDLPGRFLSGQE